MKKLILTAVVLSAATPSLASDQLANSLGVEPGQYTAAELAVLKAYSTLDGNEGRIYIDNARFGPSKSIHNPTANAQFDRSVEASNGTGVVN